ncbi:hypothetical protein CEUSTIGMA_g3610.t1 [Chlamydomonas eustigma]|uniref:Uncharacterized protein n=1 Tax=Chlamydomonas eustigma TaxID=1157962 RepID=A0A250WZF9_9CHLO|nr:hypothetical protein CEUSTIGMA_g3610.t1 [Chlamydomonas eustigma]|eukprot:GAX76166.1 hypothetical protein CEUSTIGMA_g3610.t1 [Chlamydomonas eustigma]
MDFSNIHTYTLLVLQLLITFIVGSFILVLDVKSESFIDPLCNWMANTSESILLMITIMGLMLYNPLTLQSTIDAFQNLILIFVIGYVALGVLLIAVEGFFQMYISVLKSRHNTIAKKWGHKIRRYRFMYDFFTPMFMFRWLFKAKLEDWQDWHKLCVMLVDYSHPTCEASYLSSKKIGRSFWRYMLHSFPETIDYLATVDLSHREHFSEYIEVMYQYFFETKDEVQHQLHDIINDKYRAPFAQFLAGADDEEIAFVNKVMKSAFEKARGKAAVREMAVAANRAKSATSARNAESMNHVESSFNSFSKSMESMPTPTKAVVVAAMSTIDDKDFGKVSEIHMKEETSEISSSGGKSTPSENAKRETLVSSEVELAAIRSSGNDVMPFDSVEPPRTFYAGSHEAAVHPGAAALYLDEFEDILDLPAQRKKSQAAWDNIEAQLTLGTSMSQKSRSGSRGVSRAGGSVVNNMQDIQTNAEVQDEDAGSRVWPALRAAEVTNSYVPPQPILETVSSFRHDIGELEDEVSSEMSSGLIELT